MLIWRSLSHHIFSRKKHIAWHPSPKNWLSKSRDNGRLYCNIARTRNSNLSRVARALLDSWRVWPNSGSRNRCERHFSLKTEFPVKRHPPEELVSASWNPFQADNFDFVGPFVTILVSWVNQRVVLETNRFKILQNNEAAGV